MENFTTFPIPLDQLGGMTQQEANDNLESTKKRDKKKDDYCEDNGLLLLRIPYWDKVNIKQLVSEFVRNNVLVR